MQTQTFGALILLICFTVSCNQSAKEIKTYNNAGKLDNIKYFQNGHDTSTYYVKYFRDDGTLKCEGQKANSQKSGKWKYYNTKQVIESIEKFGNGLLTDTQTYYFADGKLDRYKILDQPVKCFCDTPCHYGFTQIAYWSNGNLRERSHLKDCEFDGKTQLYDSATGILHEEFFETNGQRNGLYKKFYLDSSVMIGNYKDGKPFGKWETRKGDSLISEMQY